jgi:hypothetical protein
VLYRIGLNGEDLGSVTVPDAQAGDWEDIAAFDDAGGPALLIGDIGDNFSLRKTSTLYAVRDGGRDEGVRLLWKLPFRYADGTRDCEALAVDPIRREILLITKRDKPPRIYRLPLPDQPPRGEQIARFAGELPNLLPLKTDERLRAPLASPFYNSPTAFDVSRDGLAAVVVTPRDAYLYRRSPLESWADALQRPGQVIGLPRFSEIEAGALSADGRWLYIGSEGRPAPFARIELPPGSP